MGDFYNDFVSKVSHIVQEDLFPLVYPITNFEISDEAKDLLESAFDEMSNKLKENTQYFMKKIEIYLIENLYDCISIDEAKMEFCT